MHDRSLDGSAAVLTLSTSTSSYRGGGTFETSAEGLNTQDATRIQSGREADAYIEEADCIADVIAVRGLPQLIESV